MNQDVSIQKAPGFPSVTKFGLEQIEVIHEMLIRVDWAILKCDALLEKVQPIASGAIRIEWYKSSSHIISEMAPRIVSWHRNRRSGRWNAVPHGYKGIVRRAKRVREFGRSYEATKSILWRVEELFLLRTKLVDTLSRLRLSVQGHLRVNQPYLEGVHAELDDLIEEIGLTFPHKELRRKAEAI